MNNDISGSELETPKVTTGPLPASRKIYSRPEAAPDLRVPTREIALTEGSGEPPLPVYDTTGPYTDPDVAIDVEKGLARKRTKWVLERGGVEDYQGRDVKPEDNGNVGDKHAARTYPATHRPLRGISSPSPLVGEGRGGGSEFGSPRFGNRTTPTPNPSPQGGGEKNGHKVTQLEFARAGIITKEMIF